MTTSIAAWSAGRRSAWCAVFIAAYTAIALPAIIWFDLARLEPSWLNLVATALLGLTLSLLSAIDIETYRLPDVLTFPLIAGGVFVFFIVDGWDEASLHMAMALIGYGVLWSVATLYRHLRGRDGLGLGDAKLFAASGAWLGLEGLPAALFLASVIALAGTLCAALLGQTLSGTTRIPFGPFLALGTWLVWLYGPMVVSL